MTTVTCPASVTYSGSAQTPCTAAVTGVGSLEQTLTVNYTANTNAGTAHAAASFAGDANHQASADEKTFTIAQAVSVTTVTCPASVTYSGSAQTPCTAAVTGVGGLQQTLTVNYTANTNAGTAHGGGQLRRRRESSGERRREDLHHRAGRVGDDRDLPGERDLQRIGADAVQRGGDGRRRPGAVPDGELHRQHERGHGPGGGQLRRRHQSSGERRREALHHRAGRVGDDRDLPGERDLQRIGADAVQRGGVAAPAAWSSP